MKFLIERSDLLKAARGAGTVSGKRTTISILHSLRLEVADDGAIAMTGTNLETFVTMRCRGDVEEPGVIAVPAKPLTDLLALLPNGTLECSADERCSKFTVKSDRQKSSIVSLPGDDFPMPPASDECTTMMTIKESDLHSAISRGLVVIDEEDKYECNGILTDIHWSAKDGHVFISGMSKSNCSISLIDSDANVGMRINQRHMAEVANALDRSSDHDVMIATGRDRAIFSTDEWTIVTRLSDGKAYLATRLLPTEYLWCVTVERSELLSALQRVLLICQVDELRNCIVKLDPESDDMTVSTVESRAGDSKSMVQVEWSNRPSGAMEITCGVEPMRMFLTSCRTDKIEISGYGENNYMMFTPVGDERYIGLMAPYGTAQ